MSHADTESGANTEIAARVTAYLQRHLAFYQSSLEAVAHLDPSDADALEAYVQGMERNAGRAEQLNTEQAALLKEWRGGTGVEAAVQARVRALAAEASAMAAKLTQAIEAAEMRAESASASVSAQMQTARKNVGASRKFYGGTQDDLGGFVDQQV